MSSPSSFTNEASKNDINNSNATNSTSNPKTESKPIATSSSIIKKVLSRGFTSLAAFEKKTNASSTVLLPNPDVDIARAKVHFVDPAFKNPSPTSSFRANQSKQNLNSNTISSQPPSYFSLIDNILKRDYNHTLRNIPYQSLRNGTLSSIDAIQIQCVKTETAASFQRSASTGSNNSDSNASSISNHSPISLLFGRGRAPAEAANKTASTNNQTSSSNIAKSSSINNDTETSDSSSIPSTKFSSSSSKPKSVNIMNDPTSWHMGHYCHVYIAACESLEHYRTKVRPSLQAFISQIDSNHKAASNIQTMANGSAGTSTSSSSNSSNFHTPNVGNNSTTSTLLQGSQNLTCSQYIIVYIPVPSSSNPFQQHLQNLTQSASGGVGVGGLRARAAASLAAHRRGSESLGDDVTIQSSQSTILTGANGLGGVSMRGVGGENLNSPESNLGSAVFNVDLSLLSSKEKEVYKRLNADFPQGRVSVLSTLVLSDGVGGTSIMTPAQIVTHQQEWNVFMRNLGLAIVAGFRDRFTQYKDQLRHLEKRRALATSTAESALKTKINLTQYFLVKESLAFSYEQMQLHSEALLQYKEVSVVIPSALWSGGDATAIVNPTELAAAAMGHTSQFRSKIRSNQVTEIELYHYLFCREIHLLFKMHKPVDVITQAYQHILFLDAMQRSKNLDSDPVAIAQLEASGLSACWDVKSACDLYFSFSNHVGSGGAIPHPMNPFHSMDKSRSIGGSSHGSGRLSGMSTIRNMVSGIARGTVAAEKERDASQKLGTLLEFARLRLLVLGDLSLAKNPIRLAGLDQPLDTHKEWLPWEQLNHDKSRMNSPARTQHETNIQDTEQRGILDASTISQIPDVAQSDFLRDCFGSESAYEAKYLQLSGSIINLYQHAGFPRFATRLLTERAEIFILRKDYQSAARILSKIVDSTPLRDQLWDKIYFWRLFRLACCQRMSSDSPIAYLKTLVRCFTSRLARITPLKTSILFQRDLEALIKEESVCECSLSISPLFEIELLVSPKNGTSGNTYSQHPLGFLRKKLTKFTCMVGDTMSITVFITSSLPKRVTLDRLRLFLVSYDQYEKAYHRSSSGRNKYQGVNILESDAYRILPLEDDIIIDPGRNEFKFDWIPMTVGHFALASMDLQWSNAAFFHDSSMFRRPIQGIEVLPSNPTQTIELNPLFLIPGHEQEIRLVFSSGQDIITDGSAHFICSDGIKILVPDADPEDEKSWRKSCIVKIKPCDPGSTSRIKTLVRSSNITGIPKRGREMGGVQTIKANIHTSYHHNLYNELTESGDEEPKSKPMTTELDIMVTTLDRPALTVYKTAAVAISDKKVIVSASLHCNTPLPFSIKEWDITFPPPLVLEKDGDLNKGLFGHPVVVGEELFFGFSCKRTNTGKNTVSNMTDKNRPTLHVVLQDEIGKTFHQVLPLDLDAFYRKMRKEDEFSGMNTARATLKCSSDEGVVGSPAYFTFNVDISSLVVLEKRMLASKNMELDSDKSNTLLYSISCDENDWILSGRVQGIVDHIVNEDGTVSFSLDFIGIPTRPGLLTAFPEIHVLYKSMSSIIPKPTEDSPLPPIVVHCDFPDSFRSLPYTNHMALATPTVVDGLASQT